MQQPDWPQPWLRQTLAYEPRDLDLFRRALTHRSAGGASNERLEFLGDSVLNLIVSEHLFARFAEADEGQLSRLRARVVSAPPLAAVGLAIEIGSVLQMGGGELQSGGYRRESTLADATEALIAAVYLDGGLDAARALVLRLFAPVLDGLDVGAVFKDAKTRLQELLQARSLPLPVYELQRVEGEPHAQTFFVSCQVRCPPGTRSLAVTVPAGGLVVQGAADGSTRRRAEQAAAEQVLDQLGQVTRHD
jgi:ribonuclease-3